MTTHDWFWACASPFEGKDGFERAGKRFVIANGKTALWRRVRSEIDPNERCSWNAIHQGRPEPTLGDILDMMLTVAPCYGIRKSTFVIEAAQIPVFAKFIKEASARASLCNYVSSSMVDKLEDYDRDEHIALGRAVNRTLGIDDKDWWEL
jgi:hypothetical protein